MAHTVKLKPRAEKEYAKLTDSAKAVVYAMLEELEKSATPADSKPLQGRAKKKGYRRHTKGDFRVIYLPPDTGDILWVAKIGDRKDVYRFIKTL